MLFFNILQGYPCFCCAATETITFNRKVFADDKFGIAPGGTFFYNFDPSSE